MSSSDGFSSLVIFKDGELGEVFSDEKVAEDQANSGKKTESKPLDKATKPNDEEEKMEVDEEIPTKSTFKSSNMEKTEVCKENHDKINADKPTENKDNSSKNPVTKDNDKKEKKRVNLITLNR